MSRCKHDDCLYLSLLSHETKVMMCYYCYDVGISRNCPPEECTCYKPATPEEKYEHRKARYQKSMAVRKQPLDSKIPTS